MSKSGGKLRLKKSFGSLGGSISRSSRIPQDAAISHHLSKESTVEPSVVQVDDDDDDIDEDGQPKLDEHNGSQWSFDEIYPSMSSQDVKEEFLDEDAVLSNPHPVSFYSWQVCEGALVEKTDDSVLVEPDMEVKEEEDDDVPYISGYVSEGQWGDYGFQAGDVAPVSDARHGGGRRRSGETTSVVWEFFALPQNGNVRDSEIVICKMCNAIVRRGKATSHLGTSALWAHMRRKHPDDIQESYGRQASDSSASPEPTPRTSNIATNYSNQPKQRRVLSEAWNFSRPCQRAGETQPVPSPNLVSHPQSLPLPPPQPVPLHRPYNHGERARESRIHRPSELTVHERAMREAMFSCVATYCGLCWQLLSRGERDENLRAHLVEMHLRMAHPVRFRNLEREVAMEMYF